MLQISLPGTPTTLTHTETFVWDDLTTHVEDGLGRLVKTESSDGVSEFFEYDPIGRVKKQRQVDGEDLSMEYTFDGIGRLATLTYPTVDANPPVKVRYVWDRQRPRAVVDITGAAPLVIWQATARNLDGRATRFTFGNGLRASRAYDDAGRLTSAQLSHSALIVDPTLDPTPYQGESFEYDFIGNLVTRTDKAFLAGAEEGTLPREETFAYDGLDRLSEWVVKGQKQLPNVCAPDLPQVGCNRLAEWHATTAYRYDALGSMLSRETTQGEPHTTADPSLIRRVEYEHLDADAGPTAPTLMRTLVATGTPEATSEETTFEYDLAGRQTEARRDVLVTRKLEFTPADLPRTIDDGAQTWAYRYAADHRRVRKGLLNGPGTLGETRSAWEFYDATITEAGTLHAFTVSVGGRPVAQRRRIGGNEETWYLHTDHLNTTDTVTDQAGNRVSMTRFEPFGGPRDPVLLGDASTAAQEPPKLLRTWEGLRFDAAGLVDMRGRMYDPALGRFLSRDPLATGSPIGQNRYAFVADNPLRGTDPSGYFIRLVGSGVSSASPGSWDAQDEAGPPREVTIAATDGHGGASVEVGSDGLWASGVLTATREAGYAVRADPSESVFDAMGTSPGGYFDAGASLTSNYPDTATAIEAQGVEPPTHEMLKALEDVSGFSAPALASLVYRKASVEANEDGGSVDAASTGPSSGKISLHKGAPWGILQPQFSVQDRTETAGHEMVHHLVMKRFPREIGLMVEDVSKLVPPGWSSRGQPIGDPTSSFSFDVGDLFQLKLYGRIPGVESAAAERFP